ncbi:MAG: tetratricopeptide repeat protein, partial [Spirochaetota bacterium]|nr:tetratricopeptide repeat protein [Spirochaetota bacterium]
MKDKDIKKNRIFFVRQEPEEDVEKEFKKNRIKAIESEKKRYIPLLVASLSAVIVIIAIFIIIKYFYKKPQIFSPKEKTVLSDNEKKEIPLIDTESVHLRRGKDSFFKGYYNDAIAEFKEVVESGASDKDKAVALTYIGIIYDDRGEYNKAVEYYSRALKYDNTNPVVYRNLSLTYRHKKDLEKAQETIRKGLEIDPNNINNRLLYGNILFEQVKYEDAKLQYKKVIELDQNNSGALHNLALTLLKTGDESSAIKYLIKAGSSDKIGKVAYLSYSRLGVIFSERKDYVNALKYLKLATSINKKDPVDRYNLGIVYLKLNKKDKALYEFLKAEELGKDDVKLLENLG